MHDVSAYLEEEGSGVQGYIAALFGSVARNILAGADCSGHGDDRDVNQESDKQCEPAFYQEKATCVLTNNNKSTFN